MKINHLVKILWFFSVLGFVQSTYASKDWGYSGETGPEHWGHLSNKYQLCTHGKQQSPIKIGFSSVLSKEPINFSYKEIPLDLVLNSKNLYVNTRHSHNEYVTYKNTKYFLQHVHFHTPSEHALFGKRYPLEAHLVHQNKQGDLLVVGILVKKGRSNDILHQLFSVPFPQTGHEEIFKTVHINPMDLIPAKSPY